MKAAISLGYWFTTAPQVHNGVLYIGSTRSESHIPGGHVLAVDAKSGKVLWYFNTIPQDEKDQGWEIAGPTWVGGERNGGGIWETPSIDPALNMVYVAVGNPFGDSTKRVGMLRTLNRAGVEGFSSTFSFANRTRPNHSVASSSIIGAIIRHGPHHAAHMSIESLDRSEQPRQGHPQSRPRSALGPAHRVVGRL